MIDLDGWCGNSPFWDWNVTWYGERPDLTSCFQRSVLIWLPCLFLWLFLPFEIYYIRHSKQDLITIPYTWLNVSKLVINCGLIALTICDLTIAAVFFVDYLSIFVKIASFTLSATLLYLNKKNGRCTSGLLFLFWFLLSLFGLVQLRSELHNQSNTYAFFSYFVYYSGVLAMFLLNIFVDRTSPDKNEPLSTLYTDKKKQWPEEKVSFVSKLFFTWFDSVIWTGFRRALEITDFWDIRKDDKAENVVVEFEKHWKKSLKQASEVKYNSNSKSVYFVNNPRYVSVLPALCKAFGPSFIFATFLKVFYDVLQFIGPLILKAMIRFIKEKEVTWKGYVYSWAIFASTTTQTLILAQYFYRTNVVGVRVRTALSASIYRKSLRMSNGARKGTTLGEIVNLMSVDAQRFVDCTQYLNLIWSAPLQIVLAVYFLWQELGPPVLAGLAVMVILIPLNGIIANKTKTLQIKQMKNKDERVKQMNEILNGIKVLKLYGWEPSFEAKVMDIRDKEIRVLKRIAYLNSMTSFIWSCAPYMVSLVSFATYVFVNPDGIFDANKAFVSLSLFNILRFPISMLPMMISNLVQTYVSLKRINRFMNNEDLSKDSVTHDPSKGDLLSIENGTFQWSDDDTEPILQDINLTIKKGSLCAIVGSVGSGKSSLIGALMGEMVKVSGKVNSVGSVALVQQQAWIQNATLRDNVLFGKQFDPNFYNKVIDACALVSDLEMLPTRDQTEIGEKGINLSGGQKQRVSLARAVYNNADIYLFDDPLSAVDSHVGKHIFNNVIGPQGLLKKKTRVLVTHSVTYLPKVDYIVVLNNGRISEVGTYAELRDKKGAFADFLVQYFTESRVKDDEEIEEIIQTLGIDDNELLHNRTRSGSKMRLSAEGDDVLDSGPERKTPIRKTPEKELTPVNGQKIIEIEKAEIGKVKWEVYIDYIKSIGWFLSLVTVVFNIVFQGFLVSSNLLLSIWVNDKNATDANSRNHYLQIYGVLGIGQVISIIISSLALYVGVLNGAHVLHNRLLHNVLRSPCTTFFDVTPVGRILNRFAKDIDTMDNVLPTSIRGWMSCLLAVIATIGVIGFAVPVFIIIVIPIGIIYYLIQKFYVATSRQIKRIESISRSPIYSHFGESVSGTQTIRAFNVQDRFIRESDERIDLNQACYFPSVVANRWLAVRLEMIGNFIIFFSCLFTVFSKDSLTAGIVGLAISYSLQITQTLNWLVRMSSDVETNIVSVERIKEYSETEQEAAWENKDTKPPENWPESGEIVFNDYSFRYRTGLDLVLKNISFTVVNGQKVGIVGRTGAGKSSLTLALFRIIEASGGKILIDGVDISKLGLHTLRAKLTIIPQDPVLFSGTLRMNLDPFHVYKDIDLWKAVENSHLKSFVQNLPNGFDHMVTEGGENLSVGQRQLVCLARALLRKTKILVLDEATAAVDLETDDLIQKTIRKEFSDCTVLTIAHRLNTILDSDKVLILDRGQIVEYDHPTTLLNDRSSKFYDMAKDAGIVY